MAYRWGNCGNTDRLYFLGFQNHCRWLTAAMKLKDTCSLEEKLWQNLDGILKSRNITLPAKVCIVKAMVFPVVMYVCESWTIKKAECQRIDAFELWCCRRLLRVHWTARRSDQSVLKEIKLEYSLKGLMLKLKVQCFCHLMRRASSLEKTLMLGKIEGRNRGDDTRWDCWMASPIQWTWVWANSRKKWRTGKHPWVHKESDTTKQPNNNHPCHRLGD